MTLDVGERHAAHEPSAALKGTNTLLLVVALILLIAGFPFLLFGTFITFIEQHDAIPGGRYFAFGGLVAVLCALGIKEYLRRRDGWFS